MNIEKIIEIAKTKVEAHELKEHRNQYTLILNSKDFILELLKELKENQATNFDMLVDITAIDWARTTVSDISDSATNKNSKRFELVYFLYSNENKSRLRIKIPIDENDCKCPTVENIYPSANWYEREVWDMYGIKFEGHSDMRRFYMPEDFFNQKTGEQYHPLRKDFPLTGIPDSLPLPPFPERTKTEVDW